MAAVGVPAMARFTTAGLPAANVPAGMSAPALTNEWAATSAPAPMLAPSSTVAPLATMAPSPTVAPCTTQRWPTVAPGPISQGWPCGAWSTEPSCTLAPARTTMGAQSARRTALYQTDAPASTVTAPTRVAVSATKASGCDARRTTLERQQSHLLEPPGDDGARRL